MRYRLEMDNGIIVRNVEADVELGAVSPSWGADPHDPNRSTFKGCFVVNHEGEDVATLRANRVRNPIQTAMFVIANDDAGSGYAGLKYAKKNPDPFRVEFMLGSVLADIVTEYIRAWVEWSNGSLKAETKRKIGKLIAELHDIWWASRFGSYDAERNRDDPYFSNTPPSKPRMNFAAAAQHYGLFELQMRFPQVSEATLKEMLTWPLDLLDEALKRIFPA